MDQDQPTVALNVDRPSPCQRLGAIEQVSPPGRVTIAIQNHQLKEVVMNTAMTCVVPAVTISQATP